MLFVSGEGPDLPLFFFCLWRPLEPLTDRQIVRFHVSGTIDCQLGNETCDTNFGNDATAFFGNILLIQLSYCLNTAKRSDRG